MDQLDRDLKQVQLRREQLALERELAHKRMKERVFDGAVGTASKGAESVLRLLAGILRFITRWWKLAFLVVALAAAAIGGMEWKRNAEEERKVAEEQRYYAAEAAFVLKECGQECIGNGTARDLFACDHQNLERYFPCRSAASKRFAMEWHESPERTARPVVAETPAVATQATSVPALGAAVEVVEPAAAGSVLHIDFGGESWAEIKDASGRMLHRRLNNAGSSVDVRGQPPFDVFIGNPADARLTYNGRPIDLKPFIEGMVARFTLEESLRPKTAQSSAEVNTKSFEIAELMARGEKVYAANCAACHQADGVGLPGAFPAINGSKIVNGPIADHIDRVMNGKPGTAMAAFGPQLSNADIAAVVTYQRNAWDNKMGDATQPAMIAAARGGAATGVAAPAAP